MPALQKHKVSVIGSGNWGCTIAKIVAENAREHPHLFHPEVQMWVYEEKVQYNGAEQNLTSVINEHHENVKYLPGVSLPTNLVANPSVVDAARDSTILIFNLPHQFISKVCGQLQGNIVPFARAVSCIKGVHVTADKISLFSDWIREGLGIYCGALSGANIASDIAREKWSETTVAYEAPAIDSVTARAGGEATEADLTAVPDSFVPVDHHLFISLFSRPYFDVETVADVAGVSLGGALKNVVAIAAGFADARWGPNARAAIMRRGLREMVKFGHEFFGDAFHAGTFYGESAGVADLITSSIDGRNYRCARLAAERGISVAEVERTELNGQKLQGTGTAVEINSFLRARGLEHEYPVFTAVFDVLEGRHTVDEIPALTRPGGARRASHAPVPRARL